MVIDFCSFFFSALGFDATNQYSFDWPAFKKTSCHGNTGMSKASL